MAALHKLQLLLFITIDSMAGAAGVIIVVLCVCQSILSGGEEGGGLYVHVHVVVTCILCVCLYVCASITIHSSSYEVCLMLKLRYI